MSISRSTEHCEGLVEAVCRLPVDNDSATPFVASAHLRHSVEYLFIPRLTVKTCRLVLRIEFWRGTTTNAIRLASLVTAINVLVASCSSIAVIIRPQVLVPSESVPTEASLLLAMYAAARIIPLALFALRAIYKRAMHALLILGALAGVVQLLDAGTGLFEHNLGKCAGPLFIAVLQFFAIFLLHRSRRIETQNKNG